MESFFELPYSYRKISVDIAIIPKDIFRSVHIRLTDKVFGEKTELCKHSKISAFLRVESMQEFDVVGEIRRSVINEKNT